MPDPVKFIIKTYSKSELAKLYGISNNTLRKWLVECHKKYPDIFPEDKSDRKHLLSPKQVAKFAEHFGEPG